MVLVLVVVVRRGGKMTPPSSELCSTIGGGFINHILDLTLLPPLKVKFGADFVKD